MAAWPSGWRAGFEIRRSRVETPFWPLADAVLGSPEFNFSSTLVNNQLVRLPPVGILNLVMLIYHYLFTLVLKSPIGEWPITYTFTFPFPFSAFHYNLTEAKIANKIITSVQSLNIQPCLISWPVPLAKSWCYRLFMCSFRFWPITRNEIPLSPMLKVSSRNSNGYSSWLLWCNLSESREGRLLYSENLTRKQLTAAILLLVCNNARILRRRSSND